MSSISPERFEDGRPMLLGGLRERHLFAAAESTIAEQWQRFFASGELPGRVGPNLYGVMCGSDSSGFEYMCAVEVESLAALPDGTGRMRVPAQRYAVFVHRGNASTLRSTWQQILEWLESGSYESAHKPDFELYRPNTDPSSGSGVVEIWVGVVAKTSRSDDVR